MDNESQATDNDGRDQYMMKKYRRWKLTYDNFGQVSFE